MKTHPSTLLLANLVVAFAAVTDCAAAVPLGHSFNNQSPSIGLNFGADEYPLAPGAGTLTASTAAGVFPQTHWNNLDGANGSISQLVSDNQGSPVTTTVSVTWTSPNTWSTTGRGEENNGFPTGGNRTLMTGYLDTTDAESGAARVTISGLGPDFTGPGYTVIVYALGSVAGRGGAYSIASVTNFGTAPSNPPTFVQDPGVDHNDTGNYLVFSGLHDANFTLTANAAAGVGFGAARRAPINALQIVVDRSLTVPIRSLFNTGVDANGASQGDDATELHYRLVRGSGVVGVPYVATSAGGFPIGPWLGDNLLSAWIGPSPSTEGPNAVDGIANYFYETRFDLSGMDPLTAEIYGRWSTDNGGMDISINGISTGQENPAQFGSWTTFHITNGFVAGTNILTFVLNNGVGEPFASGPTGLRVEMSGTAISDSPQLVIRRGGAPNEVEISWPNSPPFFSPGTLEHSADVAITPLSWQATPGWPIFGDESFSHILSATGGMGFFRLRGAETQLPTAPVNSNLLGRAEASLPLEAEALIVPEAAFREALSKSNYFRIEPALKSKALELTAAVNDPRSLGVFGDFHASHSPQSVRASLFLVVRDPMLGANDRFIMASDFFVAAVRLDVETAWWGTAPRAAYFGPYTPPSGFQAAGLAAAATCQKCCGPPIDCIPEGPETIPDTGCNPSVQFCVGLDMGLWKGTPPLLEERRNRGLSAVPLAAYGDALEGFAGGARLQGLVGEGIVGGGRPQVFTGCFDTLDKFCGKVKTACDPSDCGYSPSEIPSHPTRFPECFGAAGDLGAPTRSGYCLSHPHANELGAPSKVAGGTPDYCSICPSIMTVEGLPRECGGYAPSLGGLQEGQVSSIPPFCGRAIFGADSEKSSICSPPEVQARQKQLDNERLRQEYLAAGGRGGNEVCVYQGRGTSSCIVCDNGIDPTRSKCSQYTRGTAVDPYAADASPKGTEKPTSNENVGNGTAAATDEKTKNKYETVVREKRDPPPSPAPTNTGNNAGGPKTDGPQPPPPPKEGEGWRPHSLDPQEKQEVFGFVVPPRERPDAGVGAGDPTGGSGPKAVGDPVLVGDGSFNIEVADLSFPGPARPLEFRRTYSSRSRDRSTLGSGWQHNWDVRIQVLNAQNAPTWTLPYAAGAKGSPTALVLHNGSGNKTLFFLDFATQLFMPQAGSTDTITKTTEGGWALRRADGHILIFNTEGFLVSDRDRFGNGFTIEYEPTPLYDLLAAYCGSDASGNAPNSTALNTSDPSAARSRYCPALAYLLGEGVRPLPNSTALALHNVLLELPLPRATSTLYNPRAYARAYFEYLLSKGPLVQAGFGERKLRPIKVTDDLGRTLRFTYYHASGINFAATPHAELLESVRGPAGTTVTFRYDQPINLPAELNEQFLVGVTRQDFPSAADVVAAGKRNIDYVYQWPGAPALSFDAGNWAQLVYERYFDFYKTFIGCNFNELTCPGELPRGYGSPGDPAVLARQQRNAYISDIAGNIIEVINSDIPESETRFEVNPFAANFDQVTAQRYGSRQANQDPSSVPADAPSDQWRTHLPKGVFTYRSAGPAVGGGDLTDGFLPQQILTRYPLETLVVVTPVDTILAAVSPSNNMPNRCDYVAMEGARPNLPGYVDTVPYYDPIPAERHPEFCLRLFRTRLTSEQLALAQLSDPTHNDLLSTLHPITTTANLNDHTVSRIVGRRKFVAANANRICDWVQFINRDGNEVYYGLNYRGQVLVEALKERANSNYIFTEHLYNADGLMVQTRRPTSGSQPWTPLAGSTLFKYDEIEPLGNQGWNEWLPVFWSRRANLLRIDEIAATGEVWDEIEATGDLVKRVGRYRRIGYEPLFNQVKFIEDGTLAQGSQAGLCGTHLDHPDGSVHYVFDYQELAYGATDLKPIFDHLLPWGFRWAENQAAGGAFEYDYATIQQWQLPLNFYDSDLNGDGQRGFPYGTNQFERLRGVPIVAIRASSGTTNTEVSLFAWAPHGRLAAALGSDGSLVVREYYSIVTVGSPAVVVYGQSRPPTDQDVSAGFRGFLARVRLLRFSTNTIPNFSFGETPCEALKGPYQWLLPFDYQGNPANGLAALGLPPQSVQAILSSSDANSPERWHTTSFSYSEIGEPRYLWTDTTSDHIVRDTDGREVWLTDSLQNVTTVQYTLLGYPARSATVDAGGNVLREVYRQFDDEGKVLYQCDALSAGGCNPLGSLTPTDGLVQQNTYWPEGGLLSTIDPAGMAVESRYNERQLLTSRRAFHPAYPADAARETQYEYNNDSDVTAVLFGVTGAPTPAPTLTETFVYDGLRRLVTRTNTRGVPWQFAYTTRDLLSRRRQNTSPYGTPNPLSSTWESIYRFDDFERPISTAHNGIVVSQVARSPGGRMHASWGAGRGTNYFTYDAAGQLVWTRDPAGNQTVNTWNADPHVATTSIMRTNPTLGRLTTATIHELDPHGLSTLLIEYGNGYNRGWHYQRRGDGVVTNTVNPEGNNTWSQPNLVGWQLARGERNSLGNYDVAYFQHDLRGQPTSVRDPGGQVTTIRYNGFGELAYREIPGQPVVTSAYKYDLLGRLESETYSDGIIQHLFEANGDPYFDRWTTAGQTYSLAFRRFDQLGRVYYALNFNPAYPAAEADRLVEERLEFDALSRVSKDSVRVGQHQPIVLESVWSLTANDSWRRAFGIDGALQSAWQETYDPNGRMARIERFPTGNNRSATTFDWLGEIYAGRAQVQGGSHVSPFRERRLFDTFGSPIRWTYSAIDLDLVGNPLDTSEGAVFCGGGWNANCGRPLLEINAVREIRGRIASLQWVFGGPQTTANSPKPWRGYTYNPMAQLHRTWEHSGIGTTIDTTLLPNHFITASQIAAAGQAAELWNYERESAIGGTVAIRNQRTSAARWALASPRGPGHQLTAVSDGTATSQLLHDGRGRIASQDTTFFTYDPRGSLALVRRLNISGSRTNYVSVEGYLYDPQGRLAAVIDAPGQTQSVELLASDGSQMVAAFDENQMLRWEAMWGPLIDQLLEWNNHKTGVPPRIPLVDHRNSIISLWQPELSRLTDTLLYDPEGRWSFQTLDGQTTCSSFCTPPADIPFAFGSAWTSRRTGLVYLRNRWYSPDLGQFVAHDPIGFIDSYNLYAYVGFDPINASDPTGLNSQGPARPQQPQPSNERRRTSLTEGKFNMGLGISESITASTSTRDDALTGRKEKRSVESKGNIDLGLSWTAISGSEGKGRKWSSYDPLSHKGSWGRESEDTTKYSLFNFGLSTSGLKVSLGDFSHTSSSTEVGGVLGDWYGGFTWDITSTGPSLKASVGLENAEAKAVAGVSLLSYSGSVGLNVLGANVSVTGGVNVGGKFGFEFGARTAVHAAVISIGIEVGGAKSSNPEAGWGALANNVLDYWVKPMLPQSPGGWQFPHPFQ